MKPHKHCVSSKKVGPVCNFGHDYKDLMFLCQQVKEMKCLHDCL